MDLLTDYEIVIVGGSFAGLSAGLTLGRSLRKVLIIDSGKPCNRFTPQAHNFLTRDGESPAAISALALQQVLTYPSVTFLTDLAVKLERLDERFWVKTESGKEFSAKKVLLSTGLTDEMPSIEGFAECWGKSVIHCPYCHGYEVHGQRIGLLGNGDMGFEYAQLIFHWNKDLVLFTHTPATFSSEQRQQLEQKGIAVVESPIRQLEHQEGYLQQIYLADGSSYVVDALYARPAFRQHSPLAAEIGCEFTDMGLIACDEFGKTSVPGVFVAGDNSSMLRQITGASANGVKAGAWLNKELIAENW